MMKTILNFMLLGVLILTGACSPTYTAYLANNSSTEDGTVRIQSNGLGSTEQKAFDNSVENAITTLLFKGIPESIQSTPMIADEAAAKQQHGGVLDCLKNKSCYSQFLTKSTQLGDQKKVKGGKQVTTDITVNIRALRTYLENNNVIRKFGF